MKKFTKLMKKGVAMLMALLIISDAWLVNIMADENTIEPVIDNNISAQGTDSFGNMLSDEINEIEEQQQKNNGCNIFSVVVGEDGLYETEALVSFETTEDCSIVVAIYDEAGEQMLATGKLDVYAGEKTCIVEIDTDDMPEYFYLKAYLVDGESLRPLSTVYESPNYTQEMQEFLAKTVNDFEEDRVLSFDSSENNNFAVYSEDIVVIEQNKSTINIVEDTNISKKYVIENASDDITSLNVGDILSYEYDDGSVLIIKVAFIEVDGTTVVIYGDETSMDEVFDYVKIDNSVDASEAVIDDSNLEEGVEYKGLVEVEETPDIQTYGGEIEGKLSGGHELKLVEKEIGTEGKKAKLSGNIVVKFEGTVKCYLSLSYQYFEFKLDYSLKAEIGVTGEIAGKIELVTFGISPVAGVYIEFTPSFIVEFSAKLEISAELKGTVGFRAYGDGGSDNLTSPAELEAEVEVEGEIFLGISMEPRVKIISERVADAELDVKVGGQITASKKWEPESDSEKHECENCLDGDISIVVQVSFEISFLNAENLTFKIDLVDLKIKVADFYYSKDHNEFGWGTCPYIMYKVTVNVKDENGKGVINAMINDTYSTEDKGYAVFYLPSGDYVIKAVKGKAYGTYNLAVRDNSKKIEIKISEDENIYIISGYDESHGYISENGDLYVWGDNDYGQLGDGTTKDRYIPKKIMENVKMSSISSMYGGAITENGDLYMWGNNEDSRLGDGTTEDTKIPKKIMEDVKMVSVGGGHSGAIIENGDLYMWGWNCDGQLGDGTYEDIKIPKKIMEDVKMVSLNNTHSGAITENGDLYMWGWNLYSQIGDGTDVDIKTPKKIMEGVKQVSLGPWNTAAITENGELYMWGRNYHGQLGDGTTEKIKTPKKIMENVKMVSLGGYHSAAITENGDLYMWGKNDKGQLGDGTTEDTKTPKKIMENVKMVRLGTKHSVVITEDGDLYAWGSNGNGQLGDGTTENKNTPTKIKIPSAATYSVLNASRTVSYSALSSEIVDVNEKLYTDLTPNETYNFYALKSSETDDFLLSDNLLYVTQAISDKEGNLNISYAQKEAYDDATLILVGMNEYDISNAVITVEDLEYTGEEQFADIVVTYNGIKLEQDIDYCILGDYLVTEAGEYTLVIEGMGKYTGLVNVPFEVRSYVINYELAGGVQNELNPTFYSKSDNDIPLYNPTRENYVFEGWYREAEHINKLISIPVGNTGDITLYAKWNKTGMHQGEDGNYYYYVDDEVDTSVNGVINTNLGWIYIENGMFNIDHTGLVKNENDWWYVKEGKVDLEYIGLAENQYGTWYVVDGKVATDISGLTKVSKIWLYLTEGKVDTSYTGLAKNEYGWWYVKNGQLDRTYTGMAKNENGWFYVRNGQLDITYTGLAENEYGTWYMVDGKVATDISGLTKVSKIWLYLIEGKVDISYTGLGKNEYGWWYIKEGQLDRTYTGMAKNENGWFYVKSGKVDLEYTGLAENEYGTWYMVDGKVASNKSGLTKVSKVWLYLSKGKVDTSYTGLAKNENGWFYVKNGQLDRTYTGLAKNEYGWWYVKNGQLDRTYTGLAKNEYGWWYVKNGQLDRTYTGISTNQYGKWYVKNGKVDLTYTGTLKINGVTYNIKVGKVIQ